MPDTWINLRKHFKIKLQTTSGILNTRERSVFQLKPTKTISILLTEYSDWFSKIYRIITGKRYTHAPIGIEGYRNKFFSFVTKGGFRTEMPRVAAKFSKNAESCALYHLEVTEEVYEQIKTRLEDFKCHAKRYRYSFFGAALCFLRIPHHFKNHYFCSQFVAELLTVSGALSLRKPSSIYHPNDFTKEPQIALCFRGSLQELAKAI